MDFKDLQAKIKQAKSRDELSKDWSSFVEELKKAKKTPPAAAPSSSAPVLPVAPSAAPKPAAPAVPSSSGETAPAEALKPFWSRKAPEPPAPAPPAVVSATTAAGESRIKELESKLLQLETQQKAQHEQLRQKVLENEDLRGQLSRIQENGEEVKQLQAIISATQTQVAQLRQELSVKVQEIRRLEQAQFVDHDIEKERAALEQARATVQAEREENVHKVEDLLGRIEEKERHIEQLRYQVNRFESGEFSRTLEGKLKESEVKLSEIEKQLDFKSKELQEARQSWAQHERQLLQKHDDETKESARIKQKLEHEISLHHQRVQEFESQAASLSRLLQKEEHRSRHLEEQYQSLERDHRLLSERLTLLSDELKGQQVKLMRYLEPVSVSPGSPSAAAGSAPAPSVSPTAPTPSMWLPEINFGVADDPGLIFDWEDPTLLSGMEASPALPWDDPLAAELPAEGDETL